MENPAFGASPSAFQEPRKRLPPVKREAQKITAEKNLATDDEDGGTIKTHQLISMFQHRKQISPQASPNRTESTAATSSLSRTPDDSGDDDNNKAVLFLGAMHRTDSPSLPLLPQSSGHPFVSSNDTSKPTSTSSDDSSVSTMSAETGDSFRGGFRPLSPEKSSPQSGTPTRQDVKARTTDGHEKEEIPRTPQDLRQESANVRKDIKVDLFNEEQPSDVLRLRTRLATMEKIMLTFKGELRRRAEKNLVVSERKGRKKKNLRISERNECLILSQDDESLSSVPESDSSRSEDPLVSQLVGIVEKLPREDKVTLLLNLSSKENTWDIKSARVKKPDRRLDSVSPSCPSKIPTMKAKVVRKVCWRGGYGSLDPHCLMKEGVIKKKQNASRTYTQAQAATEAQGGTPTWYWDEPCYPGLAQVVPDGVQSTENTRLVQLQPEAACHTPSKRKRSTNGKGQDGSLVNSK